MAGKPNDPPANGNEPLDRDPPAPAAEVENNALTSASTPATPRVVLGMLGGVGSGKSHVARRLAALGPGRVVDADGLAHEALAAAAADGVFVKADFMAAVGTVRCGFCQRERSVFCG